MKEPRIFLNLQERIEAFKETDVYPVITTDFCAGRSPETITEAVLTGGAKILQIREKNMPDGDFLFLLKKIRQLTRKYGALLIVDDRVDAALAAEADGVHLGQEDFPVPEARKLAPELLFGLSTHNEREVIQAQQAGCNYLNIGPIYPTRTKQLTCHSLGLKTLKNLIPMVHCPFSVMGGIKMEHLPELYSCGAKHIAAVTAFTLADDPAEEIRKWRSALTK